MNLNPFIVNCTLEVVELEVTRAYVASDEIKETGILTYSKQIDSYYTERDDSTKVFHNNTIETVIFSNELKSSGRDLLLYIFYNLGRNKDWIKLKADEVVPIVGFTKPTFYSAITQLTTANIIQKKKMNQYWINPKYIFNGDRIKYFKENASIKVVHTQPINKIIKENPKDKKGYLSTAKTQESKYL